MTFELYATTFATPANLAVKYEADFSVTWVNCVIWRLYLASFPLGRFSHLFLSFYSLPLLRHCASFLFAEWTTVIMESSLTENHAFTSQKKRQFSLSDRPRHFFPIPKKWPCVSLVGFFFSFLLLYIYFFFFIYRIPSQMTVPLIL